MKIENIKKPLPMGLLIAGMIAEIYALLVLVRYFKKDEKPAGTRAEEEEGYDWMGFFKYTILALALMGYPIYLLFQ